MVLRGPRRPGDTLPPPQVTQASSTLVTMETIALRGCSPLVSVTTMSSPKSQKSCLKWGGGGGGNGLSQGTQVSQTPKRVPGIQGTSQKGPRGPGDPIEKAHVPSRPYRRGPSIQQTP